MREIGNSNRIARRMAQISCSVSFLQLTGSTAAPVSVSSCCASCSVSLEVGDVLFSDDDEKLSRLLSFLENAIQERRKILGGAAASQ